VQGRAGLGKAKEEQREKRGEEGRRGEKRGKKRGKTNLDVRASVLDEQQDNFAGQVHGLCRGQWGAGVERGLHRGTAYATIVSIVLVLSVGGSSSCPGLGVQVKVAQKRRKPGQGHDADELRVLVDGGAVEGRQIARRVEGF
jgi:hypothetical protein